MQITNKAISGIKGNNKLIAKLMILFDKSQNSIENWIGLNKDGVKDIRLTTPDAVRIIAEETGLTPDEILEEDTVKEDTEKVA